MAIWNAEDWNYRITATRTILAKSKNVKNHKILAEDIQTKLPLSIEIPNSVLFQTIGVAKEYAVGIKDLHREVNRKRREKIQ